MRLTAEILNQLSLLAIQAAEQAGDYIRQFDRALLTTHFKEAGSSQSAQVVTDVDFACQDIILTILQPTCEQYDLALLSEEQVSEDQVNDSNSSEIQFHPRLTKDYFWCIDPLDGTLPFIEGGNGYAVSIALVAANGQPVLAAVHQPITNTTYHTWIDSLGVTQGYKNKALFTERLFNGEDFNKDLVEANNTFTFYSDRSFQSSELYPLLIKQLESLANELGYDGLVIKQDAGAVVNALSVIESKAVSKAACYLKLPKNQLGGGCLWDFSATACLAEATGVWVSDIKGEQLDLNRHDSNYMNHNGVLYTSDSQLAKRLINICTLFK